MPKILLVEDVIDVAESVVDILHLYGHVIEWSEEPLEAEARLQATHTNS